jgi:hypothetical protein
MIATDRRLMDRTNGSLCAIAALADGQDPIGSAGVSGQGIDRLLFFEMSLPWSDLDRYPDADGSISQRVRAVQREYEGRRRAIEVERGIPFSFAIAPDPEWSNATQRRVLIAQQPPGPISEYELLEFLLPADVDVLVEMARAFFYDPDDLSAFDQFLSLRPPVRELFVCTHGSTDICCGMLGIPIYQLIRTSGAAVRTWRTMHIQGHRFAPTLWDFPSGYEWAFLDGNATQSLLFRPAPNEELYLKMRGWSALPGPPQVLDRQGFIEHGWEWFQYRRSYRILDTDSRTKQWRVRCEFESPKGRSGAYEGLVRVVRELPDSGCANTPMARPYRTSPEYVLEDLHAPLE